MRTEFESQLDQMHLDVVKMGGMVEQSIRDCITALLNHDEALAAKVAQNDKKIDDIEGQIEKTCLRLILRHQPVAKNLRAVVAALKMITDLERIGDQAADIAALCERFAGQQDYLSLAQYIPEMAEVARQMVTDSITAFVKEDVVAAREIIARDDLVDDLFDKVKEELIALLRTDEGAENADQAIDLMMVAKYLERIGDHAVNVSEWVEYLATGVHKSVS